MTKLSDYDRDDGSRTDGAEEFDPGQVVEELLAQEGDPPAGEAAGGEAEDPASTSEAEGEQTPGSDEEARTDQAAGGDAPPAGSPSTDIWATAPPAIKAAHEAALMDLQTKNARLIGQLSATDRALARLRRESGAKPGGQQDDQGGSQNQSDPFETEEIRKFREEYGEIAEPVLNLLKSQADKIAKLETPVAEAVQQRADDAWRSELDVFTTAHPDWEQFVNDKRYPEWLSQQPKAVQEAAARAVNVEDGQEAAWLLGQFKAHLGVVATTAPAAEETKPSTSQAAPDPKRARQLAAGRDGGQSAPPVQSGIPDDADAAVDAIIAARSQRQANRQGQFS